MPKTRKIELRFPLAGVGRRTGFRDSADARPPYPTPYAVNVRAEDPLAKRLRGGSRPGLTKYLDDDLGDVSGLLPLATSSSAGASSAIAVVADGALGVIEDGIVTYPEANLLDNDDVEILDNNDVEILAGRGSVPGASFLTSRGQQVYVIASTIDNRIQREITKRVVGVPTGDYLGWVTDFYTLVPSGATWPTAAFAWNPDCWLHGVDFTGVGWWQQNDTGRWAPLALISPRHVLFAKHNSPTSTQTIRFIRPDGTTYTATLASLGDAYEDLSVGYLDADVPDDVIPFAILPDDYDDYLTYDVTNMAGIDPIQGTPDGMYGQPVVFFDEAGEVKIGRYAKLYTVNTYQMGSVVACDTKYALREPYFDRQVGGDSGSPFFIVVDGKLVFLGPTYGVTYYNVCHSAAAIAAINSKMDDLTGESGYQLTIADLSADAITVADVDSGVLDTLEATSGTVPANCTFGAVYRDRLFLASDDNSIYVCRQGDFQDWDYGADLEDVTAATIFQLSDASSLGGKPTALVPHEDAFQLAATETTLWVLQGDPVAGGSLRNVSRDIGIKGPRAWCKTGSDVVFLSNDGLYLVRANGDGLKLLSDERIPEELVDIPATTEIALEYHQARKGVHIFLRPGSGTGTHWFFDFQTGGFWADQFQTDHEPAAACRFGDDLLIAGADGYLRSIGGDDDDGSDIQSHVLIGPLRLAATSSVSVLTELGGSLAVGSGDVTWRIVVGDSAEEACADAKTAVDLYLAGSTAAAEAYAKLNGTLEAGRNRRSNPRIRSPWYVIWLQSTSKWAYEWLVLHGLEAGRYR